MKFDCKECEEEKDHETEYDLALELSDTWAYELVVEHGYCVECAESVAKEEPEVILLSWEEETPTYMITQSRTDSGMLSIGSSDYLVLDMDEARERAKEQILDTAEYDYLEQVPEFLRAYVDWDQYAEDTMDINGVEATLASYDGDQTDASGYIDGAEYSLHIFRLN